MARTGRRPGDEDTRGTILEAARAIFAANGYHSTTIRGIAAAAGVDPALVHHYFGPKEDLFAASIELPLLPEEVVDTILADGIDNAGANLVRLFLSVWESQPSRNALLAIIRAAVTTEQGAETLREFFGGVLVKHVVPHVDGPNPELRLSAAVGHLVGIAILRYVIGFEALASATPDELVDLIAPKIQDYLTG